MNSINDNDGVYVYDKNGIFVNNTGYWTNDIWTALSGAMLYAQWSPRTYLVTFDANGGICAEQTKSVTFEATYGTLPTPTRTGYVFSGWYTAKTGGTLVTSSTTVSTASDHTLYAQWTPSPYTVSLDQQGGWNGTISVIADYEQPMPTPITLPEKQFTVTFDGTGGTPEVPSLQAVCTFLGYFASRGGVGTQYYTSTGASAHIWDVPQNSTIYANWQTSEIVLPNASRDGYSFSGWFSDRVNTDFIGNAGEYYQVNDNTTLYASWTANTYNVFFDANTGYCYLEKKEVLYDDRYGELPLATKTGYYFQGWYTAPVGGTKVEEDDIVKITSDQTLYAQWNSAPVILNINTLYNCDAGCKEHETCVDNHNYVVATFDVYINDILVADDVNEYNQSVFFDNKFEVKDIKVNAGYTYNGPNVDYDFNGYTGKGLSGILNDSDSINGKTYIWLEFSPNTYTITPDTNKGVAPADAPNNYKVSFHQSWNKFIYTPSRVGYTFIGWTDSAKVSVYDETGAHVNTGTYFKDDYWHYPNNLTIYAQWEPITYTVNLDLNAANAIPKATIEYDSYKITFDDYVHKYGGDEYTDYLSSLSFERNGYNFVGWYDAATDGTQVYDADGFPILGTKYFDNNGNWVYPNNATFYAYWTPVDYTLTIEGNKGTGSTTPSINYPTIKVTYDSKDYMFGGITHNNYLADIVATRVGYTLNGYFTNTSGGKQLFTNIGDLSASSIVDDRPTNTSGYYFYNSLWKVVGDLTVYCQWKPINYTVTLDLNAISAKPAATINYNSFTIDFDSNLHKYNNVNHSDYLSSNLPTRPGYSFTGWYSTNNGGSLIYNSDGTVRKDGTFFDVDGEWVRPQDSILYAHWSANTYIVGGMDLDDTLTSRDEINAKMVIVLDEATDQWGIKVTRVEIKNIMPPRDIQEAMDKQMKAEREKRQTLLEAQAHREASVTRAEGDKQAAILKAEAERDAAIARATGEAESIRLVYEAEANGLKLLAEAGVNETVLALKKVEALKELGHGQATKIVVPTEIASLAADMTIKGELLDIADKANITPEIPIVQNQDDCCDDDNRTTTTKDLKEQQKQNFKSMSKEERTELLDKVLHRK